jgi:prevent-host-death family protein
MRQTRVPPKLPSKRSGKSAERGIPVAPDGLAVVQATAAKNRFGAILKRARTGEAVVIAKRGVPEFVVLAYPHYHALVHNTRGRDEQQLDALREEFDTLYTQMQTSKSRQGVDRLLSSSAESLNQTVGKRTPRSRG